MPCLLQRVITFREPVRYAEITVMGDKADITCLCQYSWSSDRVCWTNWVPYETYKQIASTLETDFYLRILVTGVFTSVLYDNAVTDCYSVCLYNRNPFLVDLCNQCLIDPYANLDCALLLQQQLSDGIICMLGIPCYYLRVVPDQNTQDLSFKEYVLHNIESVKTLKLMCQDGALPSSKPQMSEFEFDWENDWEVEISKTAFAKAFGDTAFPKQRDIIYVPLLKRLYEVNSAYDEKNEGLMWRAVTWKLGLVKWTEKTNVDQGDFKDVIDCWAVNQYEDMWEEPERKEQDRQTGITQITAPTMAETNLYNMFLSDAIRYAMTNEQRYNIASEQLNHEAVVVSRNCYRFTDPDSQVLYQKPWCGDNGTLMLCLSVGSAQEKRPLFVAGNIIVWIEGNTVTFNDMQQTLDYGKTYMLIFVWSHDNLVCMFNKYEHILKNPAIPLYRQRPDMFKFDFDNGVELTNSYNPDFDIQGSEKVWLLPGGCSVYNCRMYNTALDVETAVVESVKYVTNNEHCVFNDVARPVEGEHGYAVR